MRRLLLVALVTVETMGVAAVQAGAQPPTFYCVTEKGSFDPNMGPSSPGELYSISPGIPAAGAPAAVVRCYETRAAAQVAVDQLLILPLAASHYGGICEARSEVWVKEGGGDAIVERAGIAVWGARPGYRLAQTSLCCDAAAGIAVSLGGRSGTGCHCWTLHSVPGRVCRGGDGRVYSAGPPITLPTQPPTVIPSGPWVPATPPTPPTPPTPRTPPVPPTFEKGCFDADPGAAALDPQSHYQWGTQQDTDRLAANLAYKTELLFNCPSLSDSAVREAFIEISMFLVAMHLSPGCFAGDPAATSPDPQDHLTAYGGRRDLMRDALSRRLASAIRCLRENRSDQIDLFVNTSIIIARSAATEGEKPPPPPTRKISRFGFAEHSLRVKVGASVAPKVYVVYADEPGRSIDVTGDPRMKFSGDRVVPFVAQASDAGRTFTITATFERASDSATVTVEAAAPPDTPPSNGRPVWVRQAVVMNAPGKELSIGESSLSYSYAGNQFGPQSNTLKWSLPPATLQEGQELTLELSVGHFSEWKPTRYGFEAGSISGGWNARCFASPGDRYGGGTAWGGVIGADSSVADRNSVSKKIVFQPRSATGERGDECYLQVSGGAPCSDSCGDYSAVITWQYKRQAPR
jgi:hypothetical protein